MLATGFPYDLRESQNNNLIHFNNFTMSAQAIRRAGSAALDLCYVAMGRFDGFWELKLSPWDVAAGSLIVREAGGIVSDFKGGVFDIYSKEILASNGRIHYEMVEVLKRGLA
jgi:myo-inositol-1(or 4)-monophosphatase